jgi:hypothetical protein
MFQVEETKVSKQARKILESKAFHPYVSHSGMPRYSPAERVRKTGFEGLEYDKIVESITEENRTAGIARVCIELNLTGEETDQLLKTAITQYYSGQDPRLQHQIYSNLKQMFGVTPSR